MMNTARTITRVAALLLVASAALLASCSKVENSLQGINPPFVVRQFFETWKKQDWKELYRMTHPAFMQKLRLQKLSPEESALDDETLFVREFQRVQGALPDRVLRTYAIESISEYHAGDTTVWVSALVNGKKRRVPLTLDGLVLKIDLTRIE
jgi:hypothetical protein